MRIIPSVSNAAISRIDARPLNRWDIAKLIGLLLMAIDHTGVFFFPDEQWLRAIGRGSAPIFLFLAGFGTSWRLRPDILVLAVVLTISNIIAGGITQPLTLLFNILACRAILGWRERTGRGIARPLEWYVGAVALLLLMLVVQYGSLGILFALCAYVNQRPERYSLDLRRLFWALTFITYIAVQAGFGEYSLGNTLIMIAVVGSVWRMLWTLEIRAVNTTSWPHFLVVAAQFLSRHSLYVYALHLLLLQAITGKLF